MLPRQRQRQLQSKTEQLLTEFPALYLTGPRQSGKTTLLKVLAKKFEMTYLDLGDPVVLNAAKNDPHGLILSIGNEKIAIDEFQHAPNLIQVIKEVSDKLPHGEKGKFLLAGSTNIFRSANAQEALSKHIPQLELYPVSLRETLSTYMAQVELYPLSLSELTGQPRNIIDYLLEGRFFSIATPFISREEYAQMLLTGGYPKVQDKSPRAIQAWFKSYLKDQLYKDFDSLYTARKNYRSKLQMLTPCLAKVIGELLKYSAIANQLKLNDKVVKSYVEVLELMFIVQRVPAYQKGATKNITTQMSKNLFIDTALACHSLNLRNEKQVLSSKHYPRLLENLVYMECLKQAGWAKEEVKFYHFHDKRKQQVDIIIEKNNGDIIAILVKASASVDKKDFNCLAVLAQLTGKQFKQGILFYTGTEVLPVRYEGITFYAIPIGLFLKTH